MKGGTIIVGGDAGAFTGFMMQRGRIIVLGDAGINLGDSMYDGTIFIGGKIKSFGSDAVKSKITSDDISWLKRKITHSLARIQETKSQLSQLEGL